MLLHSKIYRYHGESPWHSGLTPHKWRLSSVKVLSSVPGTTSIAQGILKLSSSNFLFFRGHYEETVKMPLVGKRATKWIVCCYVSQTWRLLRCVEGFVSQEEEAFPFALQKLRRFTMCDGDEEPNERGLSFAPTAGSVDEGCMCSIGGLRELVFELQSPSRGSVQLSLKHRAFKYLQQTGPGCYNLRTPFKVLGGLLDVGNHMSFFRLERPREIGAAWGGRRYLAIDAVDPFTANPEGGPGGDELKEEIDLLLEGGRLLEAVVATHPFHTLGFPPFFQAYGAPSASAATASTSAPPAAAAPAAPAPPAGGAAAAVAEGPMWFGTPRHLRRFPEVPWAGSVADPEVQGRWRRRGVELRLPAGCEFDDPKPPESNHFANVFAYHAPSKTVHNDDCICFFHKPQVLPWCMVVADRDLLSS